MEWGIWVLLVLWFPITWSKLDDILKALKDIRDIIKKGGAE